MVSKPYLTSERLGYYQIETEEQATYLAEGFNEAKNVLPIGRTPASTEYILERYGAGDIEDGLGFLIKDISEETRVGFVGLFEIDTDRTQSADIGVYIDPNERGNAYAAEATERLVDYAFSRLGLHRVEADILSTNKPSLSVIEKVEGFEREGCKREAWFTQGEWVDLYQFAALRHEWLAPESKHRVQTPA